MANTITDKLIINALTSIAETLKNLQKQQDELLEVMKAINRYQKSNAGPGG